jgi:hypothetical protein
MLPLIEIDDFKLSFSLLWVRDDTPFLGKVAKGVVLLVPIYNTSKRCWKVWEKAIYRLDPLPEKVIFCENNSTDNTLELITNFQLPHEVIRVWFRSDATKGPLREYEGIANVRQLLLTRARIYGASAAIFLDDDCIPQDKDFIQRFLNDIYYDKNLDIVGGSYTRDFPEGTTVASKWAVDFPIKEMPSGNNPLTVIGLKKTIEGAKKNNLPMLAFYYENFLEERIYKCSVTSGGALALSQKILQDMRMNFVPLRHDLTPTHEVSEDFGFCLLGGSLGYTIYLDFTIKFAHLGAMSNDSMKNRPWAIYEKGFEY